jgi:hypothetical protein
VTSLQVSSGAAAEAQEYLVKHEARMWRMAGIHQERAERLRRKGRRPVFACDWVFGEHVRVR